MARLDAATTMARKCADFERLFKQAQIDEMVTLFYAPAAILEGRDLPAQKGLGAITQIFREALDSYEAISIEVDQIEVHGSIAFGTITNRNILRNGDIETHRTLLVWQEIDNDWFVVRDFFFAEPDRWAGGSEWQFDADNWIPDVAGGTASSRDFRSDSKRVR